MEQQLGEFQKEERRVFEESVLRESTAVNRIPREKFNDSTTLKKTTVPTPTVSQR